VHGSGFGFAARGTAGYRFIQVAGMFVVVAVETQQLPIAAVGGIVVVVVIAVVHREFVQVCAGEFAAATPADPGVELERLFPVAQLALIAFAPRGGDDLVQLVVVGCWFL